MKFSSNVHSLSAGHSVTLKFSAVGIDKSTLFTALAEGFVVQVRTKNLDTNKYEWIESSDFTYGQVRSGQVRLVADKESFDPLAVKNLQLSTTHGEVDFAHTISVTSSAKFVSSEGERNGKPTLVINDADIHFGLGTKATAVKTTVSADWFTITDESSTITDPSGAYKIHVRGVSGGYFTRNGHKIAGEGAKEGRFTLADLDDGIIIFVNSGKENIKFNANVTDQYGLKSATDQSALIHFQSADAINHAPVINEVDSDLSALGNGLTSVTGRILADDADQNGGLVFSSNNLAFSINAASSIWTYAAGGTEGVKTALITVTDAQGATDSVTVLVTITLAPVAVNAAPVINEAGSDLSAASNSRDTVTGRVIASDADQASGLVFSSSNEAFSINAASGIWIYTPTGSNGVKTALITVTDSQGASDTVTLSVTETNALPVINLATSDLSASATTAIAITGHIAATDADGTLAYSISGTDSGFAIASDGTWTFTPINGFSGSNSATVTVSDTPAPPPPQPSSSIATCPPS